MTEEQIQAQIDAYHASRQAETEAHAALRAARAATNEANKRAAEAVCGYGPGSMVLGREGRQFKVSTLHYVGGKDRLVQVYGMRIKVDGTLGVREEFAGNSDHVTLLSRSE
jgi:hypothetical protein